MDIHFVYTRFLAYGPGHITQQICLNMLRNYRIVILSGFMPHTVLGNLIKQSHYYLYFAYSFLKLNRNERSILNSKIYSAN